jgi:hypothetical protein
MAITKQQFYEGAALYLLARNGRTTTIRYDAPFFILDEGLWIYLKYSTQGRSPWGFTLTPEEQPLLQQRGSHSRLVLGLICGSDGVAAIDYEDLYAIAGPRTTAVHVSCYRDHSKHYEISGPDGQLPSKVPPSKWPRLLD